MDATNLLDEVLNPPRSKCSARSKQSGNPCLNMAIPGGTVCRFHGGAAPQVAARAAERVAEHMRTVRDTALEGLLRNLTEDESSDKPVVDPKVKLEVVERLTKLVELVEGRATHRTESTRSEAAEIAADVTAQLEKLRQRADRTVENKLRLVAGETDL